MFCNISTETAWAQIGRSSRCPSSMYAEEIAATAVELVEEEMKYFLPNVVEEILWLFILQICATLSSKDFLSRQRW